MPSWGEILNEAQGERRNPNTGAIDFDGLRLKYLDRLVQLTGRSTVVYAADWLSGVNPASASTVSINLLDKQALMEVFKDLAGPNLDLILHSPGGQAEATDALVSYMRSKYDDVRVIVPLAAMSAATMWALAADRVVMGKHSQLGPIDPQVPVAGQLVPAGALLRQFKQVSDECGKDPSRLSAWLPTLQQYWPGLLEICQTADDLARSLVEEWLRSYMFRAIAEPERSARARSVADYFADSTRHKSHGRPIDRDDVRNVGVVVENLEDNQELQDAVLSVHHATLITLQGLPPVVKIIENNLGRKMVQQVGAVQMVPQQLPSGLQGHNS